jgi:type I restriction enzyme S subunit
MNNIKIQNNIINGWKIDAINKLGVKIIDGDRGKNYPNSSELTSSGDCLFLSATNVSKNGFVFQENQFISKEKDLMMSKGRLERGDIVITTRGTIGNVAYFSKSISYDCIRINSGMALVRNDCIKTGLKTEFLFNYFKSSLFSQELKRVSFGSAQPQLTIQIINKFKLSYPLKTEEQVRIVTILETWDKAIDRLAKKIELKKKIKKGLMQRLLTGKVRLPGFSEKWWTVELIELLDYEQPTAYIVSSSDYNDNYETPVLTANKSFILGYTHEKNGIFHDTPVVIFDDFTTDSKYVDFPFKVKSSAIKILKVKSKKADLRFVFEKMRMLNFITGGHKRHYISEYQYQTIDVPNLDEQNAISKIIKTADDEVSALENKIKQLKLQKKYLLNNLITGKIRTPENLLCNNGAGPEK